MTTYEVCYLVIIFLAPICSLIIAFFLGKNVIKSSWKHKKLESLSGFYERFLLHLKILNKFLDQFEFAEFRLETKTKQVINIGSLSENFLRLLLNSENQLVLSKKIAVLKAELVEKLIKFSEPLSVDYPDDIQANAEKKELTKIVKELIKEIDKETTELIKECLPKAKQITDVNLPKRRQGKINIKLRHKKTGCFKHKS
ncbi:MAG: hypothetical protein LBT30_07190 [Clostridiales bacterium]|jgi:glutamyl/glutaminyl-tRNA synthetase|nr:hypothetical protein [Clostridiales bacterium]